MKTMLTGVTFITMDFGVPIVVNHEVPTVNTANPEFYVYFQAKEEVGGGLIRSGRALYNVLTLNTKLKRNYF